MSTVKSKADRAWYSLRSKIVASVTNPYRIRYAETKNPILAFEAYRICRVAKVAVPDWVLEQFDAWAKVLCVERPKGTAAIVKALGLLSGSGGPSITSQTETQLRDLNVVQRVGKYHRFENMTLERAFQEVAKEANLSEERIRDIWYKLTRDET